MPSDSLRVRPIRVPKGERVAFTYREKQGPKTALLRKVGCRINACQKLKRFADYILQEITYKRVYLRLKVGVGARAWHHCMAFLASFGATRTVTFCAASTSLRIPARLKAAVMLAGVHAFWYPVSIFAICFDFGCIPEITVSSCSLFIKAKIRRSRGCRR